MQRLLWFVTLLSALLVVLAGCQPGPSTPPPDAQATIQAMVGTQLAQQQTGGGSGPTASPAPDYPATIVAQSTQISALQGTLAAPAPTPTPDDTTALRNALAAFLAWPPSQVDFEISENTGTFAQGGIKRVGDEFGAMWVAAKVEGVWMIGFVGQGVPECDRINALNIPVSWIDYCMEGNNTVHR